LAKLFNKQILKRYLQKHSIPAEQEKIQRIARWKRNLKLNRNVKEEALQAAFLKGIFGTILGYKDRTEAENKQYTMKVEPATEVDATKPDGSLGFFEINGPEQTKVVIELKGPKISLDEKQKRAGKDYGTPVEQAFGYATKYDGCKWVIVSNMIEIRLYKYDRGQGHYEEFLIPRLNDPANFKRFHLIFSRANLINRENGSLTEKLTRETAELEEDITTEFYNLYKQTRIDLFEHLKQHNPDYDQQVLFEKAQKFLDRIIFICFCEDLGLLPPHILHKAIQSGKASFSMSDTRIWEEIKGIFKAIDQGNPAKNINAYNGGLFKPDKTLPQLTIKNDFFSAIDAISAYDFDSDLDVNILGHIFEQSISDIEEIKADIQAEEYNQQASKRKKEGIFYTPEYITKYIVENSVGKYIEDIKADLGYAELPEIDAAESPQVEGKYRKKHLRFYDEYIQRLRSIKILDPACGSGAFLNQAFDYLLQEYKWVRNQRSLIEKKPLDISLQDQVFKQILQDNLYGVDLNQESVEITKLSLWLKSANKNKPLANLDDNIKCGNSLIDDPEVAGDKAFDWEAEFPEIMDDGGFDVVIGNPPYVRFEYISKTFTEYYKNNFSSAQRQFDLFCLMIERGIELLKNMKYLGFIIPSLILKGVQYDKLRKLILDQTRIETIHEFGDGVFQGVEMPTSIIIFQKCSHKGIRKNNILNYYYENSYSNKSMSQYSQKDIVKQENYLFNFSVNSNSQIILNKIDSDNIRLKEILNITRGLEIGKNHPGIKEHKFNSSKMLITGEDISRYLIHNTKYISTETLEKKTKSNEIFDNDKIVIRETGSRLTSTYDSSGIYTLRSLYNMRLKKKAKHQYKIKFILGVLNSSLIQFYYLDKFKSKTNVFPKIRISQVKTIPIKNTEVNTQTAMDKTVTLMLELKNKLIEFENFSFSDVVLKFASKAGLSLSTITTQSQFYNQIYTGRARKVRPLTVNINDNILTVYAEKSGYGQYELFKFQADDRYQRQYIKLYLENLTEEQLDEINNYSGKLPEKILQIEIPDYNKPNVVHKVVNEWQSLQDEIQSLQSKIEQTDREIDQMVYELYGLTDDEIEIVEESVG